MPASKCEAFADCSTKYVELPLSFRGMIQPKFLYDWLTQSMEFVIDNMQVREYG